MSKASPWLRRAVVLSFILAGLLWAASGAQAAASDPLFVFTPKPNPKSPTFLPPPFGFLEGPCGMGVDPLGHFYVSDYYHDAIDAYDQNADYNAKEVSGATGFLGQLAGIDLLDGPCGLAFYGAGGTLYVNDYHRAVKRYEFSGASTTITGATVDGTHPTGVDVDPATGHLYVDQRTYLSVLDESGNPVLEGPPGSEVPVQIGKGTLQDGYAVAFSSYSGTAGRLYVPDAATDTVKVYDSAAPQAGPVQEIDGAETPKGEFTSLRDASIAVDRVTGEIYLIDDLQPKDTERPQAIVYVFGPDGSYEGHLKSLVTWGMPSGLAVDNSATPTQGRVYVTSGNTAFGSVYAYGPGAATTAAIALPSAAQPPAEPGTAQGEEVAPADAGAAAPQPKETLVAPPSPLSPRPHSAKAQRKAKAHHRKAHRTHHRRVRAGR